MDWIQSTEAWCRHVTLLLQVKEKKGVRGAEVLSPNTSTGIL